jgi:two-component system, NarL family, nitrate/nitrite response regulator NarL
VIRLGIIAAVRLYRDGLALVLADPPNVEVVLSAPDWRLAASLARERQPDVILIDVPIAEAHASLRGLAAAVPSSRLVAVSATEEDSEIISWAEAGVAGYVTRENSLAELGDVIRSVARGEMPCSPRIAATLLRRVGDLAADRPLVPRLTSREIEVVQLIERGLSNKEIGRRLCIELATVKNHVHNILEKLQVHTRGEAVAMVRAGTAPEPERVA